MSNSILFISPYRHLANTANQVIASMGLKIPVEISYDYEALNALKKYPDVRIVISRGGTLRFISGKPGITTVNIGTSLFDLIKAIEVLGRHKCKKIAVVTQDNILGLKQGKLQLGDITLLMEPCPSADDIVESVDRCIKEGYDGIVGCIVAVETAKLRGIPSSFIYSDFFTIKEAILKALEIERGLNSQKLALDRLASLVDNIEEGAVIFNAEHEAVFYNENASKILGNIRRERWYEFLSPYIESRTSYPRVLDIAGHKVLLRNRHLYEGAEYNNVVLMIESAALEEQTQSMNAAGYARGLYAKKHFKDILYRSPAMADCVALASKYAKSQSTVMIFGETGVGKEGFAQSIHNLSPRANKPFVSVNCSSLPQGLVASELFGYVAGAFTGARQNGKKGLFELAQGGTIFLDEITELPLEVQSQILRVIQEREVMRIGDDKVIPLDIRIICAANKNILDLCKEGKFRFDLYYRINVLNISIPPLRERREDIIYLFKNFIKDFLTEDESNIEIEENARELLENYPWPGNVRELKNVAESVSFYGSLVNKEHLELQLGKIDSKEEKRKNNLNIPENASFKDVERIYLQELLKKHSLSEAIKISGLSRTTLWRRLKDYGFEFLAKDH